MKYFLSVTLLLLGAVLLSACTRPSPFDESSSAATAPLSAGDYDFALFVDGLERTYILHVPPQDQQGNGLPLIVVLHGTYGTGRKMQRGLGFDDYADERGFYVAYPTAYQEPGRNKTARWNDGRGTLESSQQGIDDVKFIVSMIGDIAGKVGLDESRVYVTGASNGGMMTYRLGCETAGVFAGVAPVIGNIPQPIFADCTPQTPIAFLAINGDEDPYIPISGGEVCENVRFGCEGGRVASMADSVGLFAAANGCNLEAQSTVLPALVEDGTSIEQLDYGGCENGGQVTAYIVHHGGHAWPPMAPQVAGAGAETGNLDATQTIVDFFLP